MPRPGMPDSRAAVFPERTAILAGSCSKQLPGDGQWYREHALALNFSRRPPACRA